MIFSSLVAQEVSISGFEITPSQCMSNQDIVLRPYFSNGAEHNRAGVVFNIYYSKNGDTLDASDLLVASSSFTMPARSANVAGPTYGVQVRNLELIPGNVTRHFIVKLMSWGSGERAASVFVISIPPDFKGYDGRTQTALKTIWFETEKGTFVWGDQLKVRFGILNAGGYGKLPDVSFVVSKNPTFGDADDRQFYTFTIDQYTNTNDIYGSDQFISILLPRDNPFADNTTQFYVGMNIDAKRESRDENYDNNLNQGSGIDFDPIPITIYGGLPRLKIEENGEDFALTDTTLLGFGDVVVDGAGKSLRARTLELYNTGDTPLRFYQVGFKDGRNFRIKKFSSPYGNVDLTKNNLDGIEPRLVRPWTLTIEFDPNDLDLQKDVLVLRSNDADHPDLEIPVWGNGIVATAVKPYTDPSGNSFNWWMGSGVINLSQYSGVDDDQVALMGQLKNFANGAYQMMEAYFPSGAGNEIKTMVNGWSNDPQINSVVINIGQLKSVARPFYRRLMEMGLAVKYPWSTDLVKDDDFAATVGNLKTVFAFPIPSTFESADTDGDGMPDAWENMWFGNNLRDGNGDYDGDGVGDLLEYYYQTDPTKADTDGDGFSDGFEKIAGMNLILDDSLGDIDQDGVADGIDLDPTNNQIGEMTLQITTPVNGSTIP